MFIFNAAPDFFNRMTLFVAKMLQDGSFDAHYVDENGILQYDIIKDKRFSKLVKYGINSDSKDKEYLDSNEFLTDLAHLSFGNYYDILDLKNNNTLTLKQKKQYIGDYCDYDNIILKDYLSSEEYEELKEKDKDPDWNWTADFVPTALTRGSIDSVLCINPAKLPNLKVTATLLKRMHKLFFNGLPTKGKLNEK